MMVTIDFKVPMRDRKGGIAKDGEKEVLLCDSLADSLDRQSGKITARKAIGWSRAMSRGDALVLDEADFMDLYSWIDGNDAFTNIFKINLLEVMDQAKKEGTK